MPTPAEIRNLMASAAMSRQRKRNPKRRFKSEHAVTTPAKKAVFTRNSNRDDAHHTFGPSHSNKDEHDQNQSGDEDLPNLVEDDEEPGSKKNPR